MRIAEYDLCTHIDKLVDEEEAAFKHLLMDEDGAGCLCGDNKYNTDEVRCKPWPWGIRHGQDRAVDESLDSIAFLRGDVNVVATKLHFDAKTTEDFRYDTEHLDAAVTDGKFRLRHGCHANEAPDLNHVGEKRMLRAVKLVNSFYGEQVRTDAGDFGAHAIEHVTKL